MGLLESVVGGLLGFAGQDQANRTNIKLGREQMAFQERMSNTSYQRAVKDMHEAGLNPMLAYSQGGASAPMGSMPQVQNAVAAGVNSAVGAGDVISKFQNVLQSQATIDQLNATTKKIESETLDQTLHSARLAAEIDGMRARTHKDSSTTPLYEDFLAHFRAGIRASSASAWASEESAQKTAQERKLGSETFDADVKRRRAESSIAEMQAHKERVMKAPYDLIERVLPSASSTAKSWWDRYQDFRKENPWYTTPIGDLLREYGRKK